MAKFEIKSSIKGDKEVIAALNEFPKLFMGVTRTWLKNERAQFLGGKDAKGKIRSGGYRNLLMKKSLRRRGGTWSGRMAGLFKGVIPFANNINDLKLKMGILARPHQLIRALEFLFEGGTITSTKEMPVPIYKNLAEKGYRGPWSIGNVRSGLASKAFARFIAQDRLVRISKGNRALYFDKRARNVGGTFDRKDLLFIGVHSIKVRRTLKGALDFYRKFDRAFPRMVRRGQKAVDKAVDRAGKK